MNWLGSLQIEKFLLFVFVLIRVSGIMMVTPVLGAQQVPARIRALFAAAISMVITPSLWNVPVDLPTNSIEFFLFAAGELILGLCLGLGIFILFSGIQLAGQLISQSSGLMMANLVDPFSGDNMSYFSNFLYWIVVAVFICMGGPSMVVAALLESFQTIPLGGGTLTADLVNGLVQLLSTSYLLGMQAAAPVVVAVLLSTIVLGLVGRTLPQLNILIVGFGLNNLFGFALLSISLGAVVMTFQDHVEPVLKNLLAILGPDGMAAGP